MPVAASRDCSPGVPGGSVGGPVLGSLTAGLGLAAPFLIYGAALLVAAAVVFVSLRHSAVAAPEISDEPTVSMRTVLRNRAYVAALFSNFATGWSSIGLRIALVPLFVVDAPGTERAMAGVALATFAIGNVSAVVPSGYLSDRVGRRLLVIVGLTVSALSTVAVGFTPLFGSMPVFLVAAYVTGAATGMFISPQQAAVADVVGNKARGGTAVAGFQMMSGPRRDRRFVRRGPDRAASELRDGVRRDGRDRDGGRRRVVVRPGNPAGLPGRAHPDATIGAGLRRRIALAAGYFREGCRA